MPSGPAVLDLLPRLQRALAGSGPPLLPVPADDPTQAARLAAVLGADEPLGPGEDDPSDPTTLVIGTSGSSGTPKGTLLPASALAASIGATRRYLTELGTVTGAPAGGGAPVGGGAPPVGTGDPAVAGDPAESWLLALPAQYIGGLQVLLRALSWGADLGVLDTGRPFTAAAFARAVGSLPAGRRYCSLVPTQLHRVLADPDATDAARSLTAVLLGGAATSTRLLTRAAAAGIPVVTTYGMTETCGGCVYDGVPLAGMRVDLERDGGDAGSGTVLLGGPMVARGYRGLPGDPAFGPVPGSAASPSFPLAPGGWSPARDRRRFRTGDRGEWDGRGRLRILGRVDAVITTGGVKVDPAAVEDVLAGVRGVDQIVVTAVPDPEWGAALAAVVVPTPGSAGPGLPDLRRTAQERLGPAAAPRHLVLTDALPWLGSGKPDRAGAAGLAVDRVGRQTPGPAAVSC